MDSSAAIRIFLIDDHRSVLWGLERLIESNAPRMQVVGKATTVKDALAAIRAVNPDLILLDLDLGAESGLDAVPAFISNSHARVLILTGLRDSAVHDKAVLAGARGIVGKEESPENILKAIDKVHRGELWLDRVSTSRIFIELSRQNSKEEVVDPHRQKIDTLTPRERQIVAAIASDAGATTRKIAEKLHISDHTIRNHLTAIYDKLGLSNRLELFVFASKHKITAS
jgi:DNA-binding NarL/FixJ family response regulator